ncbi:hypothetical protein N7532_009633 [Penicillium argentinense]|uniref:FAD-binding domain-containing protein n=1 Tax=Penicillium argentinense TaxID=1131581 RepID=A0A9W9EZM5_9EURO|nr:uncharacterized protein N7532_009633 [Penicillium argentinense]KAJ5090949.1 hypothetical protein N7532_009633 [Penicillium argentinense]
MTLTSSPRQKVVVVGAGPVGSLAALYAASRGDEVEVYELRGGMFYPLDSGMDWNFSGSGQILYRGPRRVLWAVAPLPFPPAVPGCRVHRISAGLSLATYEIPRKANNNVRASVDLRDPTTVPLNFTKSINLAISERGITALQGSDRPSLIDDVLRETIPMYGRMIHGRDRGSLWEAAQAYDVHGRAINALDRSALNNALLDELERTPNVKLFFNHKLTGADFRTNKAWFERRIPGDTPSLTIWAWPAVCPKSRSRSTISLQEYIDTLWCEFRIPPSDDGNFRISPNHLHIWPGQEFMFIALPSADKSFTCTLFAPSSHYTTLENSPEQLHAFFDLHFPGVCPELIEPEALSEQFAINPHLPLISIKCKPHHFSASVAIIGDAAHAVLPFYGQGLNAGLEDVRVLFEQLDQHGVYDVDLSVYTRSVRRQAAFQAYTTQRCDDTYAINDLSKQNYLEMRWGVKSPLYKLRKSIEETIDRRLPFLGWKTQYARVSFSNQRYSEVIAAVQQQSQMLGLGLTSAIITGVGALAMLAWKHPRGLSPVWIWHTSLHGLASICPRLFR